MYSPSPLWHRVTPRTVRPPSVPDHVVLTDTQTEVTYLLAHGCSNKEIAARLGLRLQTVKNHLSAIFRRTGITDRTRLALWAFAVGIASLEEGPECRA